MNNNELIFQSFHWYLPANGNFWNRIAQEAKHYHAIGITFLWLPPAFKTCEGADGVGYGLYDLYDLGEFDQQRTVRTKYGTKDEYLNATRTLQNEQIGVIVDVVMNHLMGGDETETVWVENQDPQNRNAKVGEPYQREILSKYTFPGRQGKYSNFIWDFHAFSGINDKDDAGNNDKFYKIKQEYGEGWDDVMGKEFGNFDYLMGADIEFRNPAVREELMRWIDWYYDTVHFNGVRLDAIKHMNTNYINDWINHVKAKAGAQTLFMGEYWSQDVNELLQYIEKSGKQV